MTSRLVHRLIHCLVQNTAQSLTDL